MYAVMTTFVDRLDALQASSSSIIPWGCPVPFFGDLSSARTATVGINPSNREFTDVSGQELQGHERRLPTLGSLGISRWSDVNALHLREIIDACSLYFHRNPYDRWFRVLEQVLGPSGLTFYGSQPTSCHLDLVPFATTNKWGLLSISERRRLLDASGDALGSLLRESSLELLILNGRSVVDHFEILADVCLDRSTMRSWSLPRDPGPEIVGVAYSGEVDEIGGVGLSRAIRVVGYNHNLQSSFGVTCRVIANIGQWLRSA